ncbi:MAG: hypothetical protein KatS3mg003_1499 [Candidatus Nitrosocaldaceae archaeon]|nr:MAG: hypothetical protein KatS3mg003_1499 [Candidatus Nitrosocaldaceae archaeon]
MNSEEKRELLKWMYNLGIPFMAFRSDKSPIVNDYINYLDHTKRLSLEDTIKYLEERYLIAKIEGKLFNNEKYSFAIEAENNKVKHGKGLDIGITYTILKRFLNFYKINEYTMINTTMHEGKRHNYLTNGLIQNKKFEEIGIEIIGNRHASIFLGDGYEVYNAKHLEFIDNSIVNEMSKGLELFNDIVKALKPYYKEGSRDIICLALSGYLRKKGYDIEFAKFMVENVCIIFNDEERENRIKQCVEQTYKQDIEKVSGYKIAKEVSEDLANALAKVFGIKERDEDILTVLKSLGYSKAYDLALGLLRYDLDNNKKEAEFIKDYIYVMEEPANRDETKGNWYRWNKCKWEEINYNQLVKRLTGYVRDKKDHLELEMHEILLEYNKRIKELEEKIEAIEKTDNTTARIYEKELRSIEADKDHIEKAYRDYYKELEECIASGNKRNELLHTLETDDRFNELHIVKSMLDSYNDLAINTRSHLLVYDKNIKRYIPIEHGENTKKYYPTKVMNVNYNPNAKCIKFAEFLKTIALNNKELAMFLATVLGLCMLRRKEEVAFIFHGYGNNGKSTLLEVAKDIMNDYVRDSNISLISNREDEGKNPEFVACVDKHLVVIDEPTRVKIVGRLLKALISTGKRSARTLNARPQEYEKTFNLIISTNPEPEIDDDTIGTYRRLCIVPFEYSIPDDKVILDYHKILLEEREGIFNMLLAGLERYLEVDNLRLLMPEVVKRYTFGMIWKDDHIKEFADRYLEKAEGINTPFKDIYEKYLEFCSYKSVKPLSKKTVSKLLDKKGFGSKVIDRVTYKLNCIIKERPDLEDITSDLDDNNINTQNKDINNNNTDNIEEKQQNTTKPKQDGKIRVLYMLNRGEIERVRKCSICKEEIPKGLSIGMFIAKHKCFRDKEVEVRVVDSKNREWIYRDTREEDNKSFNEFECSNCNKTATIEIGVDDESLDAVFLFDHACD